MDDIIEELSGLYHVCDVVFCIYSASFQIKRIDLRM